MVTARTAGRRGLGTNKNTEHVAYVIVRCAVEKCKARQVGRGSPNIIHTLPTWNPQNPGQLRPEPVVFGAPLGLAWPAENAGHEERGRVPQGRGGRSPCEGLGLLQCRGKERTDSHGWRGGEQGP